MNYYVDDNVMSKYLGFDNLSLYAVYKNENGGQTGFDYSIKENLIISASVDATSLSIVNRNINIPSSGTTLRITMQYKQGAGFIYDSLSLIVSEDGKSEVGTYTPEDLTFAIPISTFTAGTDYTVKLKAVKAGQTFTRSYFMEVE